MKLMVLQNPVRIILFNNAIPSTLDNIRNTFVLVARYACGMFMNKDMRSLWPFYTVSCTVQRRERMLWEQENVATWCDCSLFFLRVHSTRSSTYTCPGIVVCIGICTWHDDARSCLWIKKKKNIDWGQQTFTHIRLFDDEWRIYISCK